MRNRPAVSSAADEEAWGDRPDVTPRMEANLFAAPPPAVVHGTWSVKEHLAHRHDTGGVQKELVDTRHLKKPMCGPHTPLMTNLLDYRFPLG
jgi:hypothetical protein